jgi:hypothetical protein
VIPSPGMTTFIAKIKTADKGLLDFYFAAVENTSKEKYFVTTIDNDTRSHVFYMKKMEGIWRIDESLHKTQGWIIEMEQELASIIQQKG